MTALQPGEPPLDQPYPGAPFGVAFTRFWKKGFTFTGRASRSEYWKAYAATILVIALLYILATVVMATGTYSQGASTFGLILMGLAVIYAVATFIPSLAVVVRRLHDANQPGAMYFVSLIPFVGGLILFVLLVQQSNHAGIRFDVQSRPSPVPPSVPGGGAYGAAPGAYAASLTVPPPPPTAMPPVAPYGAILPRGAALPPAPVPPASFQPTSFPPAPLPPAPLPSAPLPPAPVPPAPAPPALASSFAPAPSAPAAFPPAAIPPVVGAPPRSTPQFAAAVPPSNDALDSTRMAAPLAAAAWIVRIPDGRSLPAVGAVFFGRDPSSDLASGVTLVPVDDAAKSMSKTHARIDAVANTVQVTDLHSTNGTTVTVNGSAVSLVPGDPFTITADASVTFGDYEIVIQRNTV